MRDQWWEIKTVKDDYDYPYVCVTIEEGPDTSDALRSAVDKINQEYGVPGHQLDLYLCWTDEYGTKHSEYYGPVEDYLF